MGELEIVGSMYIEVGRHGGRDGEGGMQKIHEEEVGGKYADMDVEE